MSSCTNSKAFQYRAKMKDRTEQEIALLRQFDQVANMKTDAFCRQISAIEDGSSWKLGKPHIHKLLWYVNMSYWSLHFLHQIPWFLYSHLQSIGKKGLNILFQVVLQAQDQYCFPPFHEPSL